MAKLIEGKDGSRMLVSDDTPDEIEVSDPAWDMWNKDNPIASSSLTAVDPASILLCFVDDLFAIVPIQTDNFVVKANKAKIKGTMLLVDYAWLLEHIEEKLSHLEIRIEDRAYKVALGPFSISRFVGKDLNSTTVNVHLSLSRHI